MDTIFFCWFNRPRLNQNVSVQATSTEPAQSMLFLCSYTRLSKLLVTPIPVFTRTSIQRPIPLTCQNIYKIFIKHKPFSSQVEDKSGFPLKACGNDKPYILCLLTYCLYYKSGYNAKYYASIIFIMVSLVVTRFSISMSSSRCRPGHFSCGNSP